MEQRLLFAEMLSVFRTRFPDAKASFTNSSGIFLDPAYHYDYARPGVALYGVNPTPGAPNPMLPVVRLFTPDAHVTWLLVSLDPADGDGLREGIGALLAHPALQDPAPQGGQDRTDPGQSGDPRLDTVLYPDLGGLRLDYVLPSAGLRVVDAGVLWPPAGDPLLPDLTAASHHFPVWVDIDLP